jgi:hypothetical protein
MIDTAKQYMQAGLCCLPAHAQDKRPLLPAWRQYQSQMPGDEAERWNWPRLCILCGQVSGGLEVIDFDGGGALFGEWSAEVPDDLFGRLAIQQTPSGGYHVLYRCPEVDGNQKLASRGGKCLIETRGQGGLILADPSPGYVTIQGDMRSVPTITPDEREHMLTVARSLGDDDSFEIASNGKPLSPGPGDRPGDQYNQAGDFLAVLQRHGWDVIGEANGNLRLRRPGKSGRTWSATVKDRVFYCFTSSAPPFEPSRAYSPFAVLAMLEHGGDFHAAAESISGPRIEPSDDVDLSGLLADEDLPPRFAKRPEMPPEILGDLLPPVMRQALDWMVENEIKPQPAMSLGALIALFGTTLGHQVRDDYDTRTNVMVVCLSKSSSGKDKPRKLVKRLLQESGLADLIGPERFASHAAIISLLSAGAVRLAMLDELGRMMATMGEARTAHLHEIPTTLMQCYTSSDTLWVANAYGDSQRNKTIDQPHLCILGTSVPESFFSSLTTEQLHNGLLGRMMIIEGDGDAVRQKPRNTAPPQLVLEMMRWHRQLSDGGNLSSVHACPREVAKTTEASDRHEQHCQDVDARGKRDGKHAEAIWGRTPELSAKLALIHACCSVEAGEVPVIGIESVDWGRKLANHNARLMTYAAGGAIGDTDFDRHCQQIRRTIEEAGGEMTQRDLHRSAAGRRFSVRELGSILAKLQASERIQMTQGRRVDQVVIRAISQD